MARPLAVAALVAALSATVRAAPPERPGTDTDSVATAIVEMLDAIPAGDAAARERTSDRLAALPQERRCGLLLARDRVRADPRRAAQREVLDEALAKLGPSELHDLLTPYTSPEAVLRDRQRALSLLKELDVRDALGLALDAAANAPEEQLRRPLFRRAVQTTLGSLLAQDGGRRAQLLRRLPGFPAGVQETVLDALGDELGTWELSRLLGPDVDLNRAVLPRLLRQPLHSPEPLDPNAALHITWCLEDDDPGTRRSAVLVIGRYHMVEVADRLLDLVECDEPGVAGAAHRVLGEMTGMSFQPRRDLWAKWLSAESRWLEERCEITLREADSEEAPIALDAMQRLARHRLHRERFTATLANASLAEDAEIRKAACATLGSLGSPAALPALVTRLDDRVPAVADAAGAAIASITGLRAPAVPADWRDRLDLSGLR